MEYALFVEHEVKYTNENPVPVRDVVAALLALEKISGGYLPRTLNALMGVDVKRAEILVEGIEHGSLIEKVLVKLVFRDEAHMDEFLDKIRDGKFKDAWQMLPGGPKVRLAMVGTLIGTLIAVGVGYALPSKEGEPHPAVNVIIIGAESYQRSPEAFVDIVNAAVGHDKKKLAQHAADFMAPAKDDPKGAVVLDGNNKLRFDHQIVQAMPRQVSPEPYESQTEYKDVDLEIRASDRDKSSTGWAGVVRDLFDRRVRLVLSPGVSAHDLANKFHVRADVIVVSRPDPKGNTLQPVQIYVERIIPDDE